jgi:histidine triad (HIT) family protein
MSEDCIFCKIVAGEIPSRTVYEDDEVFAFLDVNPLARGHTLVIPKAHDARIGGLPDGVAASVFTAMSELAPAVERAMGADGMTVAVNDGPAAGQEVPHVHGHLVPRFEGDDAGGLHSLRWKRPDLDEAAFDEVAEAIRETR